MLPWPTKVLGGHGRLPDQNHCRRQQLPTRLPWSTKGAPQRALGATSTVALAGTPLGRFAIFMGFSCWPSTGTPPGRASATPKGKIRKAWFSQRLAAPRSRVARPRVAGRTRLPWSTTVLREGVAARRVTLVNHGAQSPTERVAGQTRLPWSTTVLREGSPAPNAFRFNHGARSARRRVYLGQPRCSAKGPLARRVTLANHGAPRRGRRQTRYLGQPRCSEPDRGALPWSTTVLREGVAARRVTLVNHGAQSPTERVAGHPFTLVNHGAPRRGRWRDALPWSTTVLREGSLAPDAFRFNDGAR